MGPADPPWNPPLSPNPPLAPRTQMTSWWPRPSARAMTRTWRSVSPVLSECLSPSPAPGPLQQLREGGDILQPKRPQRPLPGLNFSDSFLSLPCHCHQAP